MPAITHFAIFTAWGSMSLVRSPAAASVAAGQPSATDFAIALMLCIATILPWAIATPKPLRFSRFRVSGHLVLTVLLASYETRFCITG